MIACTYIPDNPDTTVGQYKYDAFGRRVSKHAYDEEVVKFAYDLSGNMIYEFETSGDYLYKEYIYINGHRVLMIAPDGAGQLGGCATADGLEFVWVSLLGVGAILLVLKRRRGGLVLLVLGGIGACGDVAHRERVQSSLSSTDGFYFYHNDHLDTPHALTDYQGSVVWSATYTDFGEDISITGNPYYVQNFRFPGQYADWETGLYYNWHRYYFPAMGRYITVDPLFHLGTVAAMTARAAYFSHFPANLNSYSYVANMPTRRIDSTGLSSCNPNCPECPKGVWGGTATSRGVGGFIGYFRSCIDVTCKSNPSVSYSGCSTCFRIGILLPQAGGETGGARCSAKCRSDFDGTSGGGSGGLGSGPASTTASGFATTGGARCGTWTAGLGLSVPLPWIAELTGDICW